jgi:hypothetical protein
MQRSQRSTIYQWAGYLIGRSTFDVQCSSLSDEPVGCIPCTSKDITDMATEGKIITYDDLILVRKTHPTMPLMIWFIPADRYSEKLARLPVSRFISAPVGCLD